MARLHTRFLPHRRLPVRCLFCCGRGRNNDREAGVLRFTASFSIEAFVYRGLRFKNASFLNTRMAGEVRSSCVIESSM